MKKLIISSLVLCGLLSAGHATVVFSEDFESPDVTVDDSTTPNLQTSRQTPTSWVRNTSGYGADRHGIVDASFGAFTGSATNTQAYAFRYTSSPSIVTTADAITTTLAAGQTFTLTFDVQEDLTDNETSSIPGAIGYDAYILAFDSEANRNAALADATAGFNVLANATGTVATGPTFTTVTLSYTVTEADVTAHAGKNIGIGFKDLWTGNASLDPSSGVIDNVSFDVVAVPEPGSFALLSGCLALTSIMLRRRRA